MAENQVARLSPQAMSEWYALLHFSLDGERAGTRDPRFYLQSLEGRDPDPRRELELAERHFFKRPNRDAICRFPARYAWLREKLKARGPEPENVCAGLERAWARPIRVFIAFPAAFVGSAPSMFGHLFLVMENDKQGMLGAPAIDFAAMVPAADGGFGYAWRGLTGGYMGQYQSKPLYARLSLYNNLERRDVWLYSLSLTEEQRLQFARHFYELEGVDFTYRFFSDNCGYRALGLVDAVLGTNYRSELGAAAAPAEVLSILNAAGDIELEGVYQAANKRMREYYRRLDDETARIVHGALERERLPEGAWLADHPLAADLLYAYYFDLTQRVEVHQRELDQLAPYVSRDFHALQFAGEDEGPAHAQPHSMLEFAAARVTDEPGVMLSFMPGYHSQTDRLLGYPSGYAIEVLKGEVFVSDNAHARLERLRLVGVQSINDYWALDRRASASFTIELLRIPVLSGERALWGVVDTGLGVARRWGDVLLGVSGVARVEYSEDASVHGNLRLGPRFELLYQQAALALHLEVWRGVSMREDTPHGIEYSGEFTWYPRAEWGISMRFAGTRYQVTDRTLALGLKYHF